MFEVRTPALTKAMAAFDYVIENTKAGRIDNVDGRNIVQAGKGIVAGVGTELKVRLALPKIAVADRALQQAA